MSRQDKMQHKCKQYLDEDMRNRLRFTKLLYEKPFLGVVVTNDDQVYALGADTKNYFGLGLVTERPKLTKIDILCGKNIHQFAAGDNHVLILTRTGIVYAWGNNSHGQLGNNSTTNSTVPVIVAGDLSGQMIRQVECGDQLSVALTEGGKVIAWGSNEHGRTGNGNTTGSTLSAAVVKGLLEDERIVKISCNWASVCCLSENGKVFGFGYDTCNLGTGTKTHQPSPVETKIPKGSIIKEMSSGRTYTLCLTQNGTLLVWGNNSNGQLGTGDTADYTLPTRVNLRQPGEFTVVIKILAEVYTSFAMDIHGTVYSWGLVDEKKILRPTPVEMTFPEDRIELTTPSGAYAVASDLLSSFDRENNADFVISVEGKDIHVHKSILRIRSSYFDTMFSNDWKETKSGKVVLDHHSYDVYRAFLRYFYCGELGELDQAQIMSLMDLATMALDDRLNELCCRRVMKQLDVKNLLHVFSHALSLQNEKIASYCAIWALDKGLKRILESDAFNDIPAEHVRTFVHKCLVHGGFDA